MTNTPHPKSARSTILFGAVAGVALVAGLAVRIDDAPASGSGSATQTHAIAEWAGSQGLGGLSPASLSAAPRSVTALDVQIAEWARSQGLSGLSPASLAPLR